MSERLTFVASASSGQVSAIFERPTDAEVVLVLAHGAGAGMEHPFLVGLAKRLAERSVATLRYQFPYMEGGKRRTDPPGIAVSTVRAAVGAAKATAPDLQLFAGGKSFGGRMTSTAAAETLEGVLGLVFFGFPLHAPGKPGTERAAHLSSLGLPMLFLQGSRDAFARLELLRPVLSELGSMAELHLIEDADHGFRVPKRTGRSGEDVLEELASEAAGWMNRIRAG